jgi:hypothetical protein
VKPSKYSNVKAEWNGEKFDSKAELSRYMQLLALVKAGAIRDLTRQVSFVLAPKVIIQGKPKRSLIYRADFSYVDCKTGKQVVEDKKGALTEAYKIKRHLMKSVHGIDILES